MKKVIGMFLAVMSAAALWAATEGTVAVPVLNARKEPTVKSPVMMKLKSGAKVTVIRRCGENWLEIALPPDAPVYVDEVFVVGGKASRELKMFSGRGRKFPVWGELKKGEAVELQNDRAYGWARIAPPERLRLYVVALYIDGAEAVKGEEKSEVKSQDASEAKVEAKPETKPEKKTEEKSEVKSEAKAEKKPEAKPKAKTEAKPKAKPEAKPKPKAEVKPKAKPEAKLAPVKPDAALLELGIKDTDKGQVVTRKGTISEAAGSIKAASFILLGDRDVKHGFIYYPGKAAELKKRIGRPVVIRGTLFRVSGWKTPVIAVQKLEEVPIP